MLRANYAPDPARLRRYSNTKQSQVVTVCWSGLAWLGLRSAASVCVMTGEAGLCCLKRLICAAQISGRPFLGSRLFTLEERAGLHGHLCLERFFFLFHQEGKGELL